MTAEGGSARGRGAVALAITLAIQIYTAVAATAVSVLAPEIGRDLGLAPKLVGAFVGIVYAGSMTASLVSGVFIERHGAIRVSQVSVLLCATGLLLVTAGTLFAETTIVALAIAAVIIGLGYGPITAASSHILVRTTHPSRMALTFSIKQTGVPAGAALAGAALPILALRLGWHVALAAITVLGVAVALLSQIVRASLDVEHAPARPPSAAAILAPLRELAANAAIRELVTTAFVYAALQVCLVSFIVVYLTESLGYTLVTAGLVLTVANVAGVVGRIAWGGVADFRIAPRKLVAGLGVAAGTCAFATAAFDVHWPLPAILVVCAAFGGTAIGWNGVVLSEVARLAPPHRVGAITGAANFVTFGGVMSGPPLFALIAALTGGYRASFLTFGTLTFVSGLRMLRRRTK